MVPSIFHRDDARRSYAQPFGTRFDFLAIISCRHRDMIGVRSRSHTAGPRNKSLFRKKCPRRNTRLYRRCYTRSVGGTPERVETALECALTTCRLGQKPAEESGTACSYPRPPLLSRQLPLVIGPCTPRTDKKAIASPSEGARVISATSSFNVTRRTIT